MSWDRVERLIGLDNLQTLREKRVGVIGLGSGGGFVAQSLAMSGVGHFVLIDDDSLDDANIVRHVAGHQYIGRPKAKVLAEMIHQRNLNANVTAIVGRVEDHTDALDDLDVVVVAVDAEQTKYTINTLCRERGLTAIYAGVYERGEGGDVVTIYPDHGPCYACWAAELREGVQISHDEAGELDYGMIGPEGTLDAEPGLWLHVVRVAGTQADFVLRDLLKTSDHYQPLPANTVILANTALEILQGHTTPPHSAVWVEIARDPHCLVCGDAAQQATATLSLDDLAGETGVQIDHDEEMNDTQATQNS
jgi:molybdopterin/thiamine biosynthesis adenylyltransferase